MLQGRLVSSCSTNNNVVSYCVYIYTYVHTPCVYIYIYEHILCTHTYMSYIYIYVHMTIYIYIYTYVQPNHDIMAHLRSLIFPRPRHRQKESCAAMATPRPRRTDTAGDFRTCFIHCFKSIYLDISGMFMSMCIIYIYTSI